MRSILNMTRIARRMRAPITDPTMIEALLCCRVKLEAGLLVPVGWEETEESIEAEADIEAGGETATTVLLVPKFFEPLTAIT
jgi:hypothetical protein